MMLFHKRPKSYFTPTSFKQKIFNKILTWEIGKTVRCCNILLIKAKKTIQVTKILTISF